MSKVTKHSQVKERLQRVGSITSMEAINLFGATRLSAIIYNLRHNSNMDIKTVDITSVDRNGNSCTFAKYTYSK